MSNHPDKDAIDLDALALNASGARQLIRFATAAEERRYREIYGGEFNCLPVVVTVTGVVDGELLLRYRFWPFTLPSGELPALPTSQEAIADIDEGRGVVMETVRGFELKSLGGWTREQLASALAYVQGKQP